MRSWISRAEPIFVITGRKLVYLFSSRTGGRHLRHHKLKAHL